MIEVDRRGIAYVEGTTTKVTEIVLNQRWANQTAEELQADLPHLSLTQIDAALAFYRENKVRCDSHIEAAESFAREMREKSGESPLRIRLRRSGALG
jgi:uncharacterized protein (DUF433 family)